MWLLFDRLFLRPDKASTLAQATPRWVYISLTLLYLLVTAPFAFYLPVASMGRTGTLTALIGWLLFFAVGLFVGTIHLTLGLMVAATLSLVAILNEPQAFALSGEFLWWHLPLALVLTAIGTLVYSLRYNIKWVSRRLVLAALAAFGLLYLLFFPPFQLARFLMQPPPLLLSMPFGTLAAFVIGLLIIFHFERGAQAAWLALLIWGWYTLRALTSPLAGIEILWMGLLLLLLWVMTSLGYLVRPLFVWLANRERQRFNPEVPVTADSPAVVLLNLLYPGARANLSANMTDLVEKITSAGADTAWIICESVRRIMDKWQQDQLVRKLQTVKTLEDALNVPEIPPAYRQYIGQAVQVQNLESGIERVVALSDVIRTMSMQSVYRTEFDKMAERAIRRLMYQTANAASVYWQVYDAVEKLKPTGSSHPTELSLSSRDMTLENILKFTRQLRQVIADVPLPEADTRLVNRLLLTETEAQQVLHVPEYMQNYIRLRTESDALNDALHGAVITRWVVNRDGSELIEHSNPWFSVMTWLADAYRYAAACTESHLETLRRQLQDVILSARTLSDLAAMKTSLAPYRLVNIDRVSDEMVDVLLAVAEELEKALAAPTVSHERLVALRTAANRIAEAQDAINSTRSEIFAAALRRIREILDAELTAVSDQQARLVGHIYDELIQVSTIEALSRLENRFPDLYYASLPPAIEMVSRGLFAIGQNLRSALEFAPGHFARVQGIQAAHQQMVNLRDRLRFYEEGEEAEKWVNALSPLIRLLYDEGHEAGTFSGFRNPYIAGNPLDLREQQLFKGRSDLMAKLITRLRSADRPVLVVYGPRRMGKTSFLKQLPRLLPPEYIPIFFDAQGGGGTQSSFDFFYVIARNVQRQLQNASDLGSLVMQKRIPEPPLDIFRENPYTAIDDWLSEYVFPAIGTDRYLFLTIDEFEKIGESITDGRLDAQVLNQLRHMIQHFRQLIVLFAGVQTIEAIAPRLSSNPFVNATTLRMEYLTADEARALILQPLTDNHDMPAYEPAVVEEIIHLTHRQPFLVQALCQTIIELVNQAEGTIKIVEMATLQEAIPELYERYRIYFNEYWKDAQLEGQQILRALANGPRDLRAFSPETIKEAIQQRLVTRRSNGLYDIEIPLILDWTRRNQT